MKRITFYFFTLLLVFALACTKENDPAFEKTSNKDLLVNKSWKFQKLTFVQNNTLYFYTLGGSNNSFNFGNDAISFKADGTGTYTNSVNVKFIISWQFADVEESIINYTIFNYDKGASRQGVNLTVTWENVQLSTTYLKYAEIYTNSDGGAIISSAKRIPL